MNKKIIWILAAILIIIASGSAWWFWFRLNSPIIQLPEQGGESSSLLQSDNLPKLKSKDVVRENITKTARFTVVPEIGFSQMGLDCLYLDKADIKKQFEKIVSAGTIHGTYEEYAVSAIEMIVRGPIEKRVYDYGKCCKCPAGAMCDCAPCGEHASECINPTTLERVNDDGIKYGVNWFYGHIIRSDNDVMINVDNVGSAVIKDENGNITKTYKYNMHLNTDYSGKVLGPIYTLAFKNEDMYLTRENIVNSNQKFKIYGEKIQAYYCSNPLTGGQPLTGSDLCSSYKDLILVEKIINEKGENIVAQKTE